MQDYLDLIEKALNKYPSVLQMIIAIGGWLYVAKLKLKEKEVLFSIDSENNEVFLINHSLIPIEVTQGAMDVYDYTRKPELTKHYQFGFGARGTIQPNEKKVLFTIDTGLIDVMEKIWAPKKEQMLTYNPTFDTARFATIKIWVHYKKVESNKRRHKVFERTLSGHPDHGWGISYSPFHFSNKSVVKIQRKLNWLLSFIKSPTSALKQRNVMKAGQKYLDVVSILSAVQDEVFDLAEAEKKLEKLLNKKGDALTVEVKNIMKKHSRP